MAPNMPRPTKAERREAARAQAKALREEQERLERRARITRRSLFGVGVVAVAGGVTYLVVSDGDSGDGDKVPAGVEADGSWTYGADLTVGSVNEGAPVLDLYFDYSCHFCAQFEATHSEEIMTLLKDGRITLALHPVQALGQVWTDQSMNAMGVVLDQQPEAALDFHNALLAFFTQIYQARDVSMMTEENVVTTARGAGVTSEVTDGFSAAIKDGAYGKWVTACNTAFNARGFTATPAVQYDGTSLDLHSIDSLTGLTDYINSVAPVEQAPAETTEAPAEEAPAEGAPAEGAPAEEAPTTENPAG